MTSQSDGVQAFPAERGALARLRDDIARAREKGDEGEVEKLTRIFEANRNVLRELWRKRYGSEPKEI